MKLLSRAEWGASPPTRPMSRASYPMRALWLHHSVTVPTDDPAADARAVQRVGVSGGGADVAYSLLVHPDGTVLEGRDLTWAGAHTWGQNTTSLAVCLIGDYSTTAPSDAQVASVREAVAWLVGQGSLLDGAVYPTGGHRDAPLNATSCPGDGAMARLAEMRSPPSPPPEVPAMSKVAYALTVAAGEHRRLVVPAISGGFGWSRSSVTFASTGVEVYRAVVGPSERPVAALAPGGVATSRHFDGRGFVDLAAGDEWVEVWLGTAEGGTLELMVEAADS